MMKESTDEASKKLKTLINLYGPKYLTDAPYRVYQELMKTKATDKRIAGAILCVLVNGTHKNIRRDDDKLSLSTRIQKECGLNQVTSDELAVIFLDVYSEDNQKEWKKKRREGLRQFMQEDFEFVWSGFSVWDVGDGSVDCHYRTELVLSPTQEVRNEEELRQKLRKNPFLTKDDIHKHFEELLGAYLDKEFDDYCTCDDYYQPVVEDFDVDYYVSEWCRQNGFEVIVCEGEGHDDGYEPTIRGGWY